jgi:hypothetical protein
MEFGLLYGRAVSAEHIDLGSRKTFAARGSRFRSFAEDYGRLATLVATHYREPLTVSDQIDAEKVLPQRP